MNTYDAFHLPQLAEQDFAGMTVREFGDDVALRFPVLTAESAARLTDHLRAARARFAALPVARIVAAIDAAARELTTPASVERRVLDACMPSVTGYSQQMVALLLERFTRDWTSASLHALLEAELGDSAVLDGFVSMPDGSTTRALGPALCFQVFAGNVPGVAVTSLVRSLLVKAPTIGKSAAGDPLLPAVFARALARVAPDIADFIAVTYWPGGQDEIEDVILECADLVVLYGSEDAERDLRARVPAHTRFIVHGPKLSFAVIGRHLRPEDADGIAAQAALAVATFDQQGCVSPHVVYVEGGGEISADDFAQRLHTALTKVEAQLPRGRIEPEEAAAVHQARAAAEFRGLAGQGAVVYAGEGVSHTVIRLDDPSFTASCLNRLVYVKPVSRTEDIPELIRPFSRFLQTVALEALDPASNAHLAESLGELGISRVTTLERMPWPPGTWHHDGHSPLRELLRFVDIEVSR
jgi:hypothetical protein